MDPTACRRFAYVGHDEPSVKFIPNKPGSGNTITYLAKVPVDSSAAC